MAPVQSAYHDGLFFLLFQKYQLWKQEGERQGIFRQLISQIQGRKEKNKEEKRNKEIKKSCFPVKGSSSELHGKYCPYLCKIPLDMLLIW